MKRLLALLLGSFAAVSFGQNFLDVKVNEVLASGSELTNALGHAYDRVEMFNPTDLDISLNGACLGDKTGLSKYVFPEDAVIPAHGFYVVDLDPDDTTNSFHLNRAGDVVYYGFNFGRLSPMAPIETVQFGQQITDVSFGRVPDGTDNFVMLANPSFGAANIAVGPYGNQTDVRINEWMAKWDNHDDYIELFNTGTNFIDLGGMILRDAGGFYQMPPRTFIGTGRTNAFLVYYAVGAGATEGDQVPFKLDDDGDQIILRLSDDVTDVDNIAWGLGQPLPTQENGTSMGRVPDGGTNITSFIKHPTPGAPNFGIITNIFVNEMLTHTDLPLEDAVELYNPTTEPVDISGWYMGGIEWWKDNPKGDDFTKALKRYQFPAGSVIQPAGYLVVYEYQFRNNPLDDNFTFNSAHGGSLFISQPDESGGIVAYLERTYPPSANGVSFGRITNSDGDVDFVALECLSFGAKAPIRTLAAFRKGQGAPNECGPAWGPVIISELMYNGTNTSFLDEYIELRNVTGARQPLFDPVVPADSWKIDGGVSYTFADTDFIEPNGYMLLVPFDPNFDFAQLDAFRATYNIPTSVPIRGPFSGHLGNGDDIVELYRPDPPQAPPHPDVGFVPSILVDRVHFEKKSPWPTNSNGTGLALQRAMTSSYGDEPTSWRDDLPTPGGQNDQSLSITVQPESQSFLVGTPGSFTVEVAGSNPQFTWYFAKTKKPVDVRKGYLINNAGNSSTLTITNVSRKNAGGYWCVITNFANKVMTQTATNIALDPIQIKLPKKPVALTKPAGTKKLTMSGKAIGTSPQYTWWFVPDVPNNGPIALTNSAKLTLVNLTTNMNGQYFMTASNALSGAVSVTNTLNVLP
jgi:hypothetical protein